MEQDCIEQVLLGEGVMNARPSKACSTEGCCGQEGITPVWVIINQVMREGLTFEGGKLVVRSRVHFGQGYLRRERHFD